jgi:hypothetical protein
MNNILQRRQRYEGLLENFKVGLRVGLTIEIGLSGLSPSFGKMAGPL